MQLMQDVGYMFIDIALPKGNEEEFISAAKRLKTDALLFLYPDMKSFYRQKSGIRIFNGVYTDLKVRHRMKFFVASQSISRKDIENRFIDGHCNFENLSDRDKMHHRSSGLNQVLAGTLKQNGKLVIVSNENLLRASDLHVKLGRLSQNIRIQKKYRIDVAIASFATRPGSMRSRHVLHGVCKCIGMDDLMAKQAQLSLGEKLNQKLFYT
jgi:hypothetical protein